ncbi:uncharacterized protein TRAVEDRAFT_17945 [Trametes versicolor FP-101664 SS1]|uniref:uncharacterized protein n=1 Tax=Trametes versicolor (strain FP-101664) TaxID=717944 RepID=UPI0004622304|nr:uncharacterized protein TRAVEDRAFT_17945 [Trametes versicolor FP-101664 SS1]EIW61136.1 hypothetical protein TRAVEDRAFT_17945 [Trametes versicolor FP-101664 SS1]
MSILGPSVTVDDSDSRIHYSSGWGLVNYSAAFDDTLHYATGGGMTATFTFTGVQVGVTGCGGSTNDYGWPSESYVVDGITYNTDDQSNLTETPDTFFCDADFFTSPLLLPGLHTLVVTNLNGTAPNTLWLDSFWFVPEAVLTTSTQSAISGAATSSTASSGSTSDDSVPDLSLLLPPSFTRASTAEASASASAIGSGGNAAASPPQNTAAIVGGAVGGAVGFLLLAALGGYCFRKRRSSRARREPRGEAILEGAFPSPTPRGHVPRLTMREAPASTLSSASLLATRDGDTGSFRLPESVAASAASLTSGSTYRNEYGQSSPMPLAAPEKTALSALPGTPSLYSDVQSTSVASGYQDTAGVTRDPLPLSGKLDSGAPPPYVAASQ